jgi:RNA polymerase sigma-70 factor (ECF subfamily)
LRFYVLDPVSSEPASVQARDEILVERAQAGDEAAFAALYDIYFPRVYRYILARLGNASDAEDIASEVFEKMLGAIGRFRWREEATFGAWVLRIAYNQIITHHRRNGSRPKTTPLSEHLPLRTPEPEEIVQRKLALEEVRAAMEQLPGAQRQVLMLRFAGGLSISETAKVLGKQENNVKVLQHKGVSRLQQILVPDGKGALRSAGGKRTRRKALPAAFTSIEVKLDIEEPAFIDD